MNSSNEHQRSHQTRANRIIQSLLKFSSVRHQSNSSDATNSKAKKKIQDNAGQSAESIRFWSLLKNLRTQSFDKYSVTPSVWGFPSKNSSAANEMEKYNVTRAKKSRGTSRMLFFSSIFCLAFPFVLKLGSVEAANNPKQDDNARQTKRSKTHRGHRKQSHQSRARSRSPISNSVASGQSGARDSFKKPLPPLPSSIPSATQRPTPLLELLDMNVAPSPFAPNFVKYRLFPGLDRLKREIPDNIGPELRDFMLNHIDPYKISEREQKEVEVFLESYVQRRKALGLSSHQDVCNEYSNLSGQKIDFNEVYYFELKQLAPFNMLDYTRKLGQFLTIVETLEDAYKEYPKRTNYEIEQFAEKLGIDKKKVQAWFDRKKHKEPSG